MSDVRLIDANALKKTFKDAGLGKHGLIEKVFADGVYAVIDAAPAIGAEPVRHACWYELLGCGYTVCSACDFIPYSIKDKYCPNCGAKMDGGGSE